MKKVLIVVGTRPNFIKVTQFRKAAREYPFLEIRIVHTGQHYDNKMADVFFEQFKLVPDFFLNVSPGSANFQMAQIMIGLEEIVSGYKPDLMIVVGDVNSTLAAALTANKMGVALAHLESGLRSHDRSMPEEINRILTDEISDFFFITEQSGMDALIKQGVDQKKCFFVGNTMIDTMVGFHKEITDSTVLERFKLIPQAFVLMTMHRPATVDSEQGLNALLSLIAIVTERQKLVFPVHPRTIKNIKSFGLNERFVNNPNLLITEPLDYFAFQKLIRECKYIITDSGGIQEESTFLQVPCLTLRQNTERPVTVDKGTNELIPFDLSFIQSRIQAIEAGSFKKGSIPPLWDGKATQRIVEILMREVLTEPTDSSS
jgi:UDP-N-acetylglucosamine 2-epimerase (non-hydrolysing)